MKAVFDKRQSLHEPKFRLEKGKIVQNPEQSERMEILKSGATAAGCDFHQAKDHGMAPLASIHTPSYLIFLKSIYEKMGSSESDEFEIVPTRHKNNPNDFYPNSADGQIGFHLSDTSCPISDKTWDSVYWSAQTALTGADLLLKGDEYAYALCRPPGHHALKETAGGFCFLNNTAVAAEYLRKNGLRPAILDIDVHHGNGTQDIFYNRSDVLTVSIHATPDDFYPYYWGGAQERGQGRGLGYNVNLPMPIGSGDDAYLEVLETALSHISAFGANVLIVAVGLDIHENDPFQGFSVTTPAFSKIGARISRMNLPILSVQEGGYIQPELGDNLTSYLTGIQSSKN